MFSAPGILFRHRTDASKSRAAAQLLILRSARSPGSTSPVSLLAGQAAPLDMSRTASRFSTKAWSLPFSHFVTSGSSKASRRSVRAWRDHIERHREYELDE